MMKQLFSMFAAGSQRIVVQVIVWGSFVCVTNAVAANDNLYIVAEKEGLKLYDAPSLDGNPRPSVVLPRGSPVLFVVVPSNPWTHVYFLKDKTLLEGWATAVTLQQATMPASSTSRSRKSAGFSYELESFDCQEGYGVDAGFSNCVGEFRVELEAPYWVRQYVDVSCELVVSVERVDEYYSPDETGEEDVSIYVSRGVGHDVVRVEVNVQGYSFDNPVVSAKPSSYECEPN